LEYVKEAIQLDAFRVGDGAIYFRTKGHQGIADGFSGDTQRFVEAPDEEVLHGDVKSLDGSSGFLSASTLCWWQRNMHGSCLCKEVIGVVTAKIQKLSAPGMWRAQIKKQGVPKNPLLIYPFTNKKLTLCNIK
jgi:hypothetical protein